MVVEGDKCAECLYEICLKYGATESCIVIGGDSKNTNKCWLGGIHAHLQKMLGHKVFWAICMKLTNDLNIKHPIENLDGPTVRMDLLAQ